MSKVNNVCIKNRVPAACAWAVIIMTKAAQKDSCNSERNLRKSINNKNIIDLNTAINLKSINIFS
jgi:hypothetical protein